MKIKVCVILSVHISLSFQMLHNLYLIFNIITNPKLTTPMGVCRHELKLQDVMMYILQAANF